MVDLALRNILHDKVRFGITVSGVAFAVMLVLVQVGLFFGLLEKATISIEKLGADIWVTSRNTPNIDFAHTFPETYVNRVRSVPGVARADNLLVQFMNIVLPTGAEETVVIYGLEDFERWSYPWRLEEGDARDLRRGMNMILDDYASKRFVPFAVGDYFEIFDTRLKVIGRSKDALSFTTSPMAFIDYATLQELLPDRLRGKTTYIIVRVADKRDIPRVKEELKRRLPYNDVFEKAEWAEKSRRYWIANTGIGMNMYITVFLGCLVGVVIVAQTLYTTAIEHIKEFAMVKAIGGTNWDIFQILVKQAVLAAVIGYLIGASLSFAARPFLADLDLKLMITPLFAAAVFVTTLTMCIASSMLSFRKVASVDPAMVFRG